MGAANPLGTGPTNYGYIPARAGKPSIGPTPQMRALAQQISTLSPLINGNINLTRAAPLNQKNSRITNLAQQAAVAPTPYQSMPSMGPQKPTHAAPKRTVISKAIYESYGQLDKSRATFLEVSARSVAEKGTISLATIEKHVAKMAVAEKAVGDALNQIGGGNERDKKLYSEFKTKLQKDKQMVFKSLGQNLENTTLGQNMSWQKGLSTIANKYNAARTIAQKAGFSSAPEFKRVMNRFERKAVAAIVEQGKHAISGFTQGKDKGAFQLLAMYKNIEDLPISDLAKKSARDQINQSFSQRYS